MLDILEGIIAIILVIIILSMRRSKKKWVAIIGWSIYILIKILGQRWVKDFYINR